jgi:hypothetical protein
MLEVLNKRPLSVVELLDLHQHRNRALQSCSQFQAIDSYPADCTPIRFAGLVTRELQRGLERLSQTLALPFLS